MSGATPIAEPTRSTLFDRRREKTPGKRESRAAFWRMLGLVRPHRRAMTAGIVLGFGVALTYAASLGGILPLLKVVVDERPLGAFFAEKAQHSEHWYAPIYSPLARIFPQENTPGARMKTLGILLGTLIVVNLVGNVFRVASQYLVLYASNRMVMDLRRKMYHKALRIPMSTLVGDVSSTVSQFMSDVREIFVGITTLFGKVAREPLKAICVIVVAMIVDWRLTVVALTIVPPAVGLLWYFGRKVRKAAVKLLQGYGVMLSGLDETLQGIDTVKGYAREGQERKRMWRLERGMLKQQLKLAWIESFSSPLIEVVGVLAAAAGIVWLAWRTFNGEIQPPQFITMVLLLAALLDPIRKIANVYNLVQRSGAAATRVFQFLDLPEESSAPRAKRLSPPQPRHVHFQNVTFSYQPAAPPAVSNLTLEVRPGECIALVGPNGSGKSTLMKLLPRLLEAQEGCVSIDGIDVREIRLKSLREQIAIVSQRPAIFARSVRENIAYGNREASDAEVRQAAQRAFAAEFIEQWPNGYETVLGEFGATVSGGQRQRIAIARAFLKPASILIFDEATSEIDADSERKIHAALHELRRGKTTFLVAHRHTVMEMADRIAVLDEGRLVDFGVHRELLERCPLYAALYRAPGQAH